jgi:hypothetical protein
MNGSTETRQVSLYSPVAVLPRRETVGASFELKQKWEGTVDELTEGGFTATVRDLTDPSFEDEGATFDIENVSVDDRALVRPGAVFYWVIGFDILKGGQRKCTSLVIFRRLPTWSQDRLLTAHQTAAHLRQRFGIDDADEPTDA